MVYIGSGLTPLFGRQQSGPVKGKAEITKAAQPFGGDSFKQNLFDRAVDFTKAGKLTWQIKPHQPYPAKTATGSTQLLYSDIATAVDPELIRPDGTGQHYMYRVWMRPDADRAMVFTGERQKDQEGVSISKQEMGAQNFQTLTRLILGTNPKPAKS